MRWLLLVLALSSAGCCRLLERLRDKDQDEARPEPSTTSVVATPPAADRTAAADPADGWTELSSTEGRFTVRMVQGAKLSREKVNTALGTLENVTWLGERGTRVYYLSFVDYPKGKITSPDGALDGARDGAVRNVNGKVLSEKHLKVGRWPARDLSVAATTKGVSLGMRVRFIMAGDRLYTLQTVQQGSTAAEIDADATRYFESLRLK